VSAAAAVLESPRARRRRLLWTRFRRRPVAVAALVVVLLFLATAILAPYIAPYTPEHTDFNNTFAHSSWHHLLGTDDLGHDEFSRLVWGARSSMEVGFLATMLGLAIAIPIGLAAGYYGGWVDAVIARLTDVLLAFPFVIFAIGLAAILGPSLKTAAIAIGVASVPGGVRLVRGETLALREASFVPAAIANGAGDATVLFRHILPNMNGMLIVTATLRIPGAIIGEATLSFLGLGLRPPKASWGKMLGDAQSYFYTHQRLAVYPGLAIVVAALAFNLLGDGLRDVLDPRTTR
jgi:peptide/nickel transport system permease protein